ncbi:hypothetical protein PLICRDRAFT_273249 [Plicaturopsis crispa FD-325 SS-3]|nr:hypothetical protein PLICRDRAFT_273249 [Plicaturopsis crispa FD-325 SS-3]
MRQGKENFDGRATANGCQQLSVEIGPNASRRGVEREFDQMRVQPVGDKMQLLFSELELNAYGRQHGLNSSPLPGRVVEWLVDAIVRLQSGVQLCVANGVEPKE